MPPCLVGHGLHEVQGPVRTHDGQHGIGLGEQFTERADILDPGLPRQIAGPFGTSFESRDDPPSAGRQLPSDGMAHIAGGLDCDGCELHGSAPGTLNIIVARTGWHR